MSLNQNTNRSGNSVAQSRALSGKGSRNGRERGARSPAVRAHELKAEIMLAKRDNSRGPGFSGEKVAQSNSFQTNGLEL
jgi:hypothetical protein